jgi:hypothetical protein
MFSRLCIKLSRLYNVQYLATLSQFNIGILYNVQYMFPNFSKIVVSYQCGNGCLFNNLAMQKLIIRIQHVGFDAL